MSNVSDPTLLEVSLEHTLDINTWGVRQWSCYVIIKQTTEIQMRFIWGKMAEHEHISWSDWRVGSSWGLGLSACRAGREILCSLPAKGSQGLFPSSLWLEGMKINRRPLHWGVHGTPSNCLPSLPQLADDQGLVLMTTVAMPVFSKQNETVSICHASDLVLGGLVLGYSAAMLCKLWWLLSLPKDTVCEFLPLISPYCEG